jgi:hypothetical protein
VAALVGFVVVEGRSREPMMPLSLFRTRNFTGANLLTLLLYAGLGGSLYFLPFNLIQVHGYSATAAGSAFLPFIVITFLMSRWAGGLVTRYGAKLPLVIGPTIAAGGFLLFALPGTDGSYWTTFFPAICVQGLGMSLVIAPLTTTAMNSVTGRHSGLASGVNNAVSRTAALLAIPVLGIFVFVAFSASLDARVAILDLPPTAVQQLEEEKTNLGGAEVPEGLPGGGRGRRDSRGLCRRLPGGDARGGGPRAPERPGGGPDHRGQGQHHPDARGRPARSEASTRVSTPEVEAVLAWHEALNAGDAERVASLSHPDVEVGGPRGAARGRQVLRDWVARANVRLEPLRLFRRDQTVVVEEAATWSDAPSGETVGEATVATVFALDGGLVAGIIRYDGLKEALRGAGLDRSDEIPVG